MSIAQSAMKAEGLDHIKDGERKTQKRTRPGAPASAPAPETGNEDGGFRIRIDSHNYRKHPDKNKKLIRRSLKENGAGRSIVVDNTGESIGGSGVLEQAEALGLKKRIVETDGSELVVVVRKDIAPDDPRRKSLALADNATTDQSEWDFDALAVDWKPDELQEWGIETDDAKSISEGETEPDAVPEVPEEPVSQPGVIYQLGKHRLMCGDSTKAEDVARLMAGEKADMVFTDPPYGVSYRGVNNPGGRQWEVIENDDLRGDKLSEFLLAAFQNLKAHLRENRAFYIWYASSNHLQFEHAIIDSGLKSKQVLIWNKGMILGHSDYQWAHEPCFYGCHADENCEWFGDRCQTTVWDIKRDNTSEYVHPTQKPTVLACKAMFNSSKSGEVILDLFGGSGSTLIACEQTGRINRSMEFDPKYADVIRKRWAEFVHGEGCDWQALTPVVAE